MDHAYRLLDALLLAELEAARNRHLARSRRPSVRAQEAVAAEEAAVECAAARDVTPETAAAQERQR
jgi:hypothetical protein